MMDIQKTESAKQRVDSWWDSPVKDLGFASIASHNDARLNTMLTEGKSYSAVKQIPTPNLLWEDVAEETDRLEDLFVSTYKGCSITVFPYKQQSLGGVTLTPIQNRVSSCISVHGKLRNEATGAVNDVRSSNLRVAKCLSELGESDHFYYVQSLPLYSSEIKYILSSKEVSAVEEKYYRSLLSSSHPRVMLYRCFEMAPVQCYPGGMSIALTNNWGISVPAEMPSRTPTNNRVPSSVKGVYDVQLVCAFGYSAPTYYRLNNTDIITVPEKRAKVDAPYMIIADMTGATEAIKIDLHEGDVKERLEEYGVYASMDDILDHVSRMGGDESVYNRYKSLSDLESNKDAEILVLQEEVQRLNEELGMMGQKHEESTRRRSETMAEVERLVESARIEHTSEIKALALEKQELLAKIDTRSNEILAVKDLHIKQLRLLEDQSATMADRYKEEQKVANSVAISKFKLMETDKDNALKNAKSEIDTLKETITRLKETSASRINRMKEAQAVREERAKQKVESAKYSQIHQSELHSVKEAKYKQSASTKEDAGRKRVFSAWVEILKQTILAFIMPVFKSIGAKGLGGKK